MPINHAFVCTLPDGDDALKIQPQRDWNDDLVVTGGALGSLLYRDTGVADGIGWLADVAAGSVLVSGGVGAAPAWSATPSLTSLTLSTPLPIASGGTGLGTLGAAGTVLVGGASAAAWSASPSIASLTLTALAALTTAAESWIGPSAAAGVYFKGGNVGLGTTNPGARLEVNGEAWIIQNAAEPRILTGDSTSSLHYAGFTWNKAGGYVGLGGSSFPYALTVKNDGNVGIATTTPTLNGLQLGDTKSFGWSDVSVVRDAANAMALRNGTNAQTFVLGQGNTALAAGRVSMGRDAAAAFAPGAGLGMLRWETGTNAGTLKLVAYTGTSATGVTVVDNVGGGN